MPLEALLRNGPCCVAKFSDVCVPPRLTEYDVAVWQHLGHLVLEFAATGKNEEGASYACLAADVSAAEVARACMRRADAAKLYRGLCESAVCDADGALALDARAVSPPPPPGRPPPPRAAQGQLLLPSRGDRRRAVARLDSKHVVARRAAALARATRGSGSFLGRARRPRLYHARRRRLQRRALARAAAPVGGAARRRRRRAFPSYPGRRPQRAHLGEHGLGRGGVYARASTRRSSAPLLAPWAAAAPDPHLRRTTPTAPGAPGGAGAGRRRRRAAAGAAAHAACPRARPSATNRRRAPAVGRPAPTGVQRRRRPGRGPLDAVSGVTRRTRGAGGGPHGCVPAVDRQNASARPPARGGDARPRHARRPRRGPQLVRGAAARRARAPRQRRRAAARRRHKAAPKIGHRRRRPRKNAAGR